MKPGEPIHTGMYVWHETEVSRVVSVYITTGEVQQNGTVSDPETFVRLELVDDEGCRNEECYPICAQYDVRLDKFLRSYHRRPTGWDRIERLNFEVPVYEGPIQGYDCIRIGDGTGELVRIPDRPGRTRDQMRAVRDEVITRGYGSFAEWYEHIKPEGAWKLVLDPPL